MAIDDTSALRDRLARAPSDEERLQCLLDLAFDRMRTDYRETLALAAEAHALSERLEDAAGRATSLLLMGDANHSLGACSLALEQLIEARSYFLQAGPSSRVAKISNTIAGAYADMGDYSSAIDEYYANEPRVAALDDPEPSIVFYNGLGLTLSEIGDLERALEHLRTSREIAEREGFSYFASQTTGNIGKVLQLHRGYDQALEHFRMARVTSESMGDHTAVGIWAQAMGTVYNALGRPDTALAEFEMARGIASKCGDHMHEVSAIGSIGLSHAKLGNDTEALSHLERALEAAEASGFQRQIGMFVAELGRLHAAGHRSVHDPVRAEEYLLRGARLALDRGDNNDLWRVYTSLSNLYFDQERLGEAYTYRTKAFEVYQETVRQETHLKAQQLESRRRIEQIEKQRAVEQAESRAAMEIQHMKAEQLERELGNATLQLLAQTELLRDLRTDLLKIARRIPPTEPAARELRERVKRLPCESVDWERFDVQFKAVHPDFIRNLAARAPDLTATEVRICTMLRMNLKSNEIAQIFCTTERGVEFHRANIRRKLGLKRSEKLPIVLGVM